MPGRERIEGKPARGFAEAGCMSVTNHGNVSMTGENDRSLARCVFRLSGI